MSNIDLYNIKSKDCYWLYRIIGSTIKDSGRKKWEKELKLENIEWTSQFNLIEKVCRENKLREFYFKLIHRLTVTKKELCTYGLEDVNNCFYCEGLESITHTFVECNSSQTFFDKIIHWFNMKYHSTFSPTPIRIFGLATNDDENDHATVLKLNFCLLCAKYYLYNQKMHLEQCNFDHYISMMEQKFALKIIYRKSKWCEDVFIS